MKKIGLFILSLILVFTVGCEQKVEEYTNNNQEQKQEEVKKGTKVSCSGPMAGNMFKDVSGIASDNMVIYATYDSEDKLQGIFYDYEFNLSIEFEGKALDTFKSSLNKICDNKIFSDCSVNVESKKATVHTELDTTDLKTSGTYDKEAFKKEVKTLGSEWECTEE